MRHRAADSASIRAIFLTRHRSLLLGEEEGADDVGDVVGPGDLQVGLEDATAVSILVVRVVAHGVQVAVVVAAGLDLRWRWVETGEVSHVLANGWHVATGMD